LKLKKVHITNFRSVEDSREFAVDHTTCLVGKNEAGKTAVLQALASLNPHDATPFELNKVRDYPRRYLTHYDERHDGKDAVVVRTVWKLSKAEVKEIEDEVGSNVVTGREVTILRRYGSSEPKWTLSIDYKKAIENLIVDAKFNVAEKSQIKSPGNTQELRKILSEIPTLTEKQAQLLARIDNLPGKCILGQVRAKLQEKLPKFMYFSNYDRMSGEVRLEHLQQHYDDKSLFTDEELSGDRLFYEFLEYAGVSVAEILGEKTYEPFSAKLQAASNMLTDQILDYWSQNPYITVKVAVDAAKPSDPLPFNEGVIARARIYNSLHRVDMPFSERSAGFIWFFSFLIKFAQVKDEDTPIILLLDEPGLSLHGKAQADLRRFFAEQLSGDHQIIYTTHSPFMVPADNLLCARIVEDVVDTSNPARPTTDGTKVREDVLNRDPDTIFPLQGALGYAITQSLFVGKNTLLVEGPSDILYLKALSSALVRHKRNGLHPEWVICPTGGIGKIMPFVSLFKGNDLNIGVLTDVARGEKKKVEELRASEILKKGSVFTTTEFTGKVEADIEDFFDPALFVKLLNESYELTGKYKLTEDKLENADTKTPRLVKKAEAYFKLLPESIPMLDHYTPSQWLLENPSALDGDDPAVLNTLNRVEKLFEALNELIP